MSEPEFKNINVRDISVQYFLEGEDKGTPVVILLGLGATMQSYVQNPTLIEALTPTHRVLMHDNRGLGGTSSGDIKGDDMSVLAADTLAVMDALGIKKAHIIGISMGGMIAQQFALDYPDRVKKMVLGCTWAGGPTLVMPPQELYDYLTVPGKGKLEDIKCIDPLLLVVSPKFMAEAPEAAEGVRAMVEATRDDNDNEGFYNQQLAIGKFNSYDRLPEIQAETLVFGPKYDILLPPANGCLIATQIPNSHFIFLENSAHPMIEDGDFVAEKVASFFAE
jgi:pimeloyl-ACP methyl ester carboxylesterase